MGHHIGRFCSPITCGGCSGAGPVAAFVFTTPQGTEEMHFVFNAAANELLRDGKRIEPRNVMRSEYTEFNMALANVW